VFPNANYPVCILLHLDVYKLGTIVTEYEEFCVTGNEDHFQEWKRQHPGEPLDPDLPPPKDLLKAVQYLRQECLPGSLLGEWQFSLPGMINEV
jgi:hypothetical protein